MYTPRLPLLEAATEALAVLSYEIATIPDSTIDYGPQRAQDVEHLREARDTVLRLMDECESLRELVETGRRGIAELVAMVEK